MSSFSLVVPSLERHRERDVRQRQKRQIYAIEIESSVVKFALKLLFIV